MKQKDKNLQEQQLQMIKRK